MPKVPPARARWAEISRREPRIVQGTWIKLVGIDVNDIVTANYFVPSLRVLCKASKNAHRSRSAQCLHLCLIARPPWAAFERRIQPSTPQGDSRTASGALPAPNRSC